MTQQSSLQAGDFVILGTVARPHGIRGELKVRSYMETPGDLSRYRQLYLSADKGMTRVPYTNIQTKNNGNTVILKLQECTTREQAEQLAGMEIWVASSELPSVGKDEFYLYTLEGKQACLETGQNLGKITAIMSGNAQDLLVIRDTEREYLVPVVREFIVAISDEQVVLELPPGLLEINR